MSKVEVVTNINDLIIEQTTNTGFNVSRVIIDTQELQFRNALIKLGWTPPGEEFKNNSYICDDCGCIIEMVCVNCGDCNIRK